MAKLRQLKRQRASDIGKPTGLGIGNRFGGDHEQIQRMLGHGRPSPHYSRGFVTKWWSGSSRALPASLARLA